MSDYFFDKWTGLICVFMCFRAEGGGREGSDSAPLRETKTQRDGAESEHHGRGAAGPEDGQGEPRTSKRISSFCE